VGGPNGSFPLQFRVARSGRQVTQLQVASLDCAMPQVGGYGEVEAGVGSARIRRNGTFRATLMSASGNVVTMTGRFLAHGRARGTLRYRGRGANKGCNVNGIWTARVKPPPPPVEHFTGTTEEGTVVTFERTIERDPHVTRFNFGSLSTALSNGQNCGHTIVATGLTDFGLFFGAEFALSVHDGSFSGEYFYEYYVDISGSFGANDQVSGTVSYGDRGGCSTGVVHWTAQPGA
jgi:hypothetical protein